jgi:hypothetical protein
MDERIERCANERQSPVSGLPRIEVITLDREITAHGPLDDGPLF